MYKMMKKLKPDSAPYGAYGDPKVMFKYKTLMQDYQELQKEVRETRNKLETGERKKLILLAEVRFLRQRYKYLLKNKPVYHPPEREVIKPPKFETQRKNKMKNTSYCKGVASFQKLYSKHDPNKKGKIHIGKEAAPRTTGPVLDLNCMEPRLTGIQSPVQSLDLNNRRGKEAAVWNPTPKPVIDLNQNTWRYGGNNADTKNAELILELTENQRAHGVNEAPSRSRAPIFDLNEVSGEEEGFENNCEPMVSEELKKGLVIGGTDEQLNDLKLPICRNVGGGSTRIGKRKISWQDHVALRV